MAFSLAPALLLSMPQLLDQNFCHTVILLCQHSDRGAFGLVVNRPLVTTGRDFECWVGGPMEPERSWILVGGHEYDDLPGMRVADGLSLSTSPDLLQRLLDPDPPTNARLIVGYAGWAPGQLEAELN